MKLLGATDAVKRLGGSAPGYSYMPRLEIRQGDATAGESALAYEVTAKAWDMLPCYRMNYCDPRVLQIDGYGYYKVVFDTDPLRLLRKLPGGHDWTGYERLRLDAKCDATAVLRVDVEDYDIEPPVRRRFSVPAGKWVTLEIDLVQSVKDRGLDLSNIANVIVTLEGLEKPAILLLDNLRLSKAWVSASLPLVVDYSPYTVQPRSYAVDPKTFWLGEKESNGRTVRLVEYPDLKPLAHTTGGSWQPPRNKGPWRIEFPHPSAPAAASKKASTQAKPSPLPLLCFSVGPLSTLTPVAFDAERIAVPFHVSESPNWWDERTYVAATADGGATWKGLDGEETPSLICRYNVPDGGTSVLSDELFVAGNLGCGGHHRMDRLFVAKATLTESGWRSGPATPVPSDSRHCEKCSGDILKLASGRIWLTWAIEGRRPPTPRDPLGTGGYRGAYYSDDGGRTWQSPIPGKKAMLPGSYGLAGVGGDRGKAFLVPFGDGVAVVLGWTFWRFENGKWTGPVNRDYGSKSRPVTSVAPLGKLGMLLATGGGAVYRYDGEKAFEEKVNGYNPDRQMKMSDGSVIRLCRAAGGQLSVSGDTVMMFAADDFEPDLNKVAPAWSSRVLFKKIICWRRDGAGRWTEPEVIVDSKGPILQFAAGRYGPPGFVPLAWSSAEKREISVMLVPTGVEKAPER